MLLLILRLLRNHIRKSVVNAIAGTNLKKLSIGSTSQRTGLKFPTIRPIGTAKIIESSQPFITLPTLDNMSLQRVPSLISSFMLSIVSFGLGRKYSSYFKDPIPQRAIIATHDMIPHFSIFCIAEDFVLLFSIFNVLLIKCSIALSHQELCLREYLSCFHQ